MKDTHEVQIHIKSLKSGNSKHFKMQDTASLDAMWHEAVSGNQLNETRLAEDILRCAGGADLSGHLQASLAQVREQKLCTNLHFEIKGPTGGANV